MPTDSILILGASGRLGLHLIRAAARAPCAPSIHAFVRTAPRLPRKSPERALVSTVVEGDARSKQDLARALRKTAADVVIVAVGTPHTARRHQVRAAAAEALADVVRPGSPFAHVRVVVVSAVGAAGTRLEIGMGVGTVLEFSLRHMLRDHDEQERVFREHFAAQKDRLLIVRPTGLTEGHPTGGVVVFDASERPPNAYIDRADVAAWIIDQVCGSSKHFGTAVCITRNGGTPEAPQ